MSFSRIWRRLGAAVCAAAPLLASAASFPAGTVFGAGLAWQTPDATARTWDAAGAFCSSDNSGGMTGWRLPTALELSNLYYEKGADALAAAGWPSDWIYTADTYSGQYKVVRVTDGVWSYTSAPQAVTCVHSVSTAPVEHGERSTLSWQIPAAGLQNWASAGAYCAASHANGLSGWRLPTETELSNLYYDNGASYLAEQGWTGAWIWTASAYSTGYQVVRLTDGLPSWAAPGNAYAVACVRDSNSLPANTMSSGGLVFTAPDANARDWNTAGAYCSASTAGGMTGWRLPTELELSNLYYVYGATAMSAASWPTNWIWTANPYSNGHQLVRMTDGMWSYAVGGAYPVTCVHAAPPAAPAAAPMLSSGGLTFSTPQAMQRPYTNTVGYCTGATIAGQQGWRLPTVDELTALYAGMGSSAMSAAGWPGDWIWTSSVFSAGFSVVRMSDGTSSWAGWEDTSRHYVSCVKDSAAVASSNGLVSGQLSWYKPGTLARPWANTAGYCDAPINGTAGWRLPTQAELSALYAGEGAATLTQGGWPGSWIWSSDPTSSGYKVVRMSDGMLSWADTGDASRESAACVRAADGLPAGSVTSGGLTWLRPPVLPRPWINVVNYCATLGAAGHADWRLPTQPELSALYIAQGSAALTAASWPGSWIWSSDPTSTGYKVVRMSDGLSSWSNTADASRQFVSCVRTAD